MYSTSEFAKYRFTYRSNSRHTKSSRMVLTRWKHTRRNQKTLNINQPYQNIPYKSTIIEEKYRFAGARFTNRSWWCRIYKKTKGQKQVRVRCREKVWKVDLSVVLGVKEVKDDRGLKRVVWAVFTLGFLILNTKKISNTQHRQPNPVFILGAFCINLFPS